MQNPCWALWRLVIRVEESRIKRMKGPVMVTDETAVCGAGVMWLDKSNKWQERELSRRAAPEQGRKSKHRRASRLHLISISKDKVLPSLAAFPRESMASVKIDTQPYSKVRVEQHFCWEPFGKNWSCENGHVHFCRLCVIGLANTRYGGGKRANNGVHDQDDWVHTYSCCMIKAHHILVRAHTSMSIVSTSCFLHNPCERWAKISIWCRSTF